MKFLNMLLLSTALAAVSVNYFDLNADTKSETSSKDVKKEKRSAEYKDGSGVSEEVVKKEINEISESVASKMTLADLKTLVTWKVVYQNVLYDAAVNAGILKDAKAMNLINSKIDTAAGALLMEKEVEKLMTKEALKEHYEKTWDKMFKGTKEFDLIVITTNNKNILENIKKLKDETEIQNFAKTNASSTKVAVLGSRSEKSFPPEISKLVLEQGKAKIVGPFEQNGVSVFFYVKDINDAKQQEFTEAFAENYKKSAMKDFKNQYIETLYKKFNVKILKGNKKEVDPFNIVDKTKIGKNKNSDKELEGITKLKNEDVLATSSKGNVTVADIKKFYKVEHLIDETFMGMAQQFGMSLVEVLAYATKLIMDDKILGFEANEIKIKEQQDVKEKLDLIKNMEVIHAYFRKSIKVKPEDIKKTYNDFIKSIPEEDKNDNEIAVKMAFFDSKEEADKTAKSVFSGEEKFSTVFDKKTSGETKTAIDLGYVKRPGTSPELWQLLKKGAPGACCKEILEVNGAQFGLEGKKYALIFIADRRPIQLPSLQNPQDKKYFIKLAERNQAVEIAKKLIMDKTISIAGMNLEEQNKHNPESINRLIMPLIGHIG